MYDLEADVSRISKRLVVGQPKSVGIVIIALGEQYVTCTSKAIKYLRKTSDIPVHVLTNVLGVSMEGISIEYCDVPDDRYIQVRLDMPSYSPFDYTLHLDADILVASKDFMTPFTYLETFDFIVVGNSKLKDYQHKTKWGIIAQKLNNPELMIPCAGCFWFKKNNDVFDLWKEYSSGARGTEELALFVSLWNSKSKVLYLQGNWIGKSNENVFRHSAGKQLIGLPKLIKIKSNGAGYKEPICE